MAPLPSYRREAINIIVQLKKQMRELEKTLCEEVCALSGVSDSDLRTITEEISLLNVNLDGLRKDFAGVSEQFSVMQKEMAQLKRFLIKDQEDRARFETAVLKVRHEAQGQSISVDNRYLQNLTNAIQHSGVSDTQITPYVMLKEMMALVPGSPVNAMQIVPAPNALVAPGKSPFI